MPFLARRALAIGGGIGALIAKKIPMTDMPQLIGGFHSLVGMAAVCVAVAAYFAPHSFGIGELGHIKPVSLLELSLGAAIGAITFSGSVIAFAKLNGNMSGAPITFKGQHLLNLVLALVLALLIGLLMRSGGADANVFMAIVGISFLLGFLLGAVERGFFAVICGCGRLHNPAT